MRLIVLIPLLAFPPALAAQDNLGYYRMPAIHGETVVFVAEGDLWRTPLAGGAATRLTTHAEDETDPALSPDGAWIAFTASYEGPTEVYVMPATGGLPRRLTYEGVAGVAGWTPDGKVLYSSFRHSTLPNAQLLAVDPATGASQIVPLAQAAEGSYDATGRTLYFTRFWPQSSNTKRYRGGTAQDIWKYAAGAPEAVPLTADWDGTSRAPMWWNGRVYFESDRDGTMNLWSMTEDGTDPQQHTRHVGWDVRAPSLGGGRIVYQLGADLRVYDVAAATDRALTVTLPSDFDQLRERWVDQPLDYLDDWRLSPSGDRLALTARGKVFVAPADVGRFVEVTRHRGVRYRAAQFLPDGKALALLSDESGEVEWWTAPADGLADPRQVTRDGTTLRFDGVPSPDGSRIVHWNHDQELWLTDLATGRSTRIAVSPQWGFDRPAWSPDSKWFVFGKPADNSFMQLFLYRVADGVTTAITTDRFNSGNAAWSRDGQWIYFFSDRNFQSLVGGPWGSRQPEPYFDRPMKLYAVAVHAAARFPFRAADEVTAEPADDAGAAAAAIQVEVDGIRERLLEVPVPPGNYSGLAVADKRLFYLSRETALPRRVSLMALDAGPKPDPKAFAEDIRGYDLSADGKRVAVRKGSAFYVVSATAAAPVKLDDDARVDLSGWKYALDPRDDWRHHFVESWRLQRDYFYDPEMHGVDWDAMRRKYLPLVDRVRSRTELADLQAQMAGELSTLHIYVYGGDRRDDPRDVSGATLGARLARDEAAGGWRVAHVFRADPDLPDERSPLARYGVDVRMGDVITAINGVSTLSVVQPHALLRNQAGKQVRLTVRRGSDPERAAIVEPIGLGDDADLRYDEWEYTRRLAVDSASGGSIGYVHLRAMGANDAADWYREFYPQFNRQGLIVDVRHNGGGNIESWILEKLLRKAWMYWQPRVGDPYWNMQYAFRGHMVVLVNERTASDGEAFADGFRRLEMGQVIGTRTWGGEIWLSSSNRLADRGIVTAAEFGVYADGEWLIEGWGVDPDVVVDNLPHATFRGADAQLAAAVAHLRQLIARDPRAVPPPPAYPDKSTPDNRARATNGGR
jgi:tricorn protease